MQKRGGLCRLFHSTKAYLDARLDWFAPNEYLSKDFMPMQTSRALMTEYYPAVTQFVQEKKQATV